MENSRENPALVCQVEEPRSWLSEYLHTRAHLASSGSDFHCDPACSRPGCNSLDLQIPVSIVDLMGAARYRQELISALYRRYYSLGVYSDQEDDWLRLVSLKLKKPCPFLENDLCRIYPVRPLPCIVFPEYLVHEGSFAAQAKQAHFRDYLCLRRPLVLSPERARVVAKLRSMWERERIITSYYLFKYGACHIDFSNLTQELTAATANMREAAGIMRAEPVRVIPSQVIEQFFREHMAKCQPLASVSARIDHLNNPEGQEEFRQLLQDDLLLKKLTNAPNDRALVYRFKKGKLQAGRRSLIASEYKFY